MLTRKKCRNCGIYFIPRIANQKFCCDDCRVEHKKKYGLNLERNCVICGKSFITKSYGQTCCSYVCRKKLAESKENLTPTGMLPKRKCHDCGKPTYNYRCDKCLKKWRERWGVGSGIVDVLDAYKCYRSC